ncbi:MAG: hypothetical protein ABI837_06700 [Acidobacteriota bacterium]
MLRISSGNQISVLKTSPNDAFGEPLAEPGGTILLPHNYTIERLQQDGSMLANFGYRDEYPFRLSESAGGKVYGGGLGTFVSAQTGPSGVVQRLDTIGGGFGGLDLAADQCTLYFTIPSGVWKLDVCHGGSPLALSTSLPSPSPGGIRVLTNGDILVADRTSLLRLDPAENIVRNYGLPANYVALDSSGATAWIASARTITRINLTTGAVIGVPFDTGSGIYGISTIGEWRAATAAATIPALTGTGFLLLCLALGLLGIRRLL